MKKFVIILSGAVVLILVFVFLRPAPTAPNGNGGAPNSSSSTMTMTMTITSSAFEHNGKIPVKYTCDGENINPPLDIQGIPEGTKSLALIMDDPDAPRGTFTHWVWFDLDVFEHLKRQPVDLIQPHIAISEERGWVLYAPYEQVVAEKDYIEGINSTGKFGYTGPCPPPGKPHRYFFTVYALDTYFRPLRSTVEERQERLDENTLKSLMVDHILAKAELMGTYGR